MIKQTHTQIMEITEQLKEDLQKYGNIEVNCNDIELHTLWDAFEDGRLEQPAMTGMSSCGKYYVIHFVNYPGVVDTLESLLKRGAQKINDFT